MFPNAKGSEELSILATIDPISQGVGTVSTPWINVVNFHTFLAVIQTGVLGASATLTRKSSRPRTTRAPVSKTSLAR